MDKEQYQLMYELELDHWWYRGMRAIARALLESTLPEKRGAKGAPEGLEVLDAGCGTGGMLLFLSRYGVCTGVDNSPDALTLAQSRKLSRLVQGSVTSLPLANGAFDLVTSFDVIYHQAVEEDLAALREYGRVLKAGGRLLLRVPAYEFMRSHHDEVVHTRHRYQAAELREKLADAGFEVEKLTYANCLLFPVATLTRALDRRGGLASEKVSDMRPLPAPLDAILGAVLSLEAIWLSRANLPFGLSLFAVARKTAQ